MTIPTIHEPRRGSAALTAALIIAAFLLSACGLKVSSVTTFDDNFAGKRTITMNISKEDLDKHVKGGADAAEAAALKYLPPEMTYEGKTVDDKGMSATLSIEYSSLQEYKDKITAILKAGGQEKPQITIANSTDGLVTGVQAAESFNDQNLLKWLEEALVAEGVVDQDHRGNIFDLPSEPQLVIGGKTYQSSSAYSLTVNDVSDNGVSYVGVLVSLMPDDYLDVRVLLSNGRTFSSVQSSKVREYVEAHLPAGGEILDDASAFKGFPQGYQGIVVHFAADSADAVQEGLRILTSSKQTSFSIGQTAMASDYIAVTMPLKGYLDCAALCSPKGFAETGFLLNVPKGTMALGKESNEVADMEGVVIHSDKDLNVNLDIPVAFSDIAVKTTVSTSGNLSTDINLSVDKEANPLVDIDKLDESFTSSHFGDMVSISEEGSTHEYTISISGANLDEYNQKLTTVIPIGYASRSEVKSGMFKKTTTYEIFVPVRSLMARPADDVPIEETVSLPFGHSYDKRSQSASEDVTIDGSTLSRSGAQAGGSSINFTETGYTVAGMVGIAVVLLLLIAAAVLGFIFRNKIRAKLADHKAKRAATAAAAPQPVFASHPINTAAAGTGTPGTTPEMVTTTGANTAAMGTGEMGSSGVPGAMQPTATTGEAKPGDADPDQFRESQLM